MRRVSNLADEYMRRHSLPHKKPKSSEEDERLWRVHVTPDLGREAVRRLRTERVERWHLAKQSTPYAANRALNLLSHGFTLAEGWGWRKQGTNPCRAVRRFKEQPRARYLSQFELRRLAGALDELRAEDRITASSERAIRLLALTGCRRNEILNAEWDHVDFDAGTLRLQDSKTGPREVPLSEAALRELERAPKCDRWVCPGHLKDAPLKSIQKAWERVRDRAGLRDARVHDLRRTFATSMRNKGVDLETIGEVLGQKRIETTRIYARLSFEKKRKVTEGAAEEIERALEGGST